MASALSTVWSAVFLCRSGQSFRELAPVLRSLTLAICLLPPLARAQQRQEITIQDLVRRIQIATVQLSPDGAYAAYSTLEGQPETDSYLVSLYLTSTGPTVRSVLLARYCLSPEDTFDADTGAIRAAVAQFRWKADSRQLVYTVHGPSGMGLRLRSIGEDGESEVLHGYREIVFGVSRESDSVRIHTAQAWDEPRKHIPPLDPSLLIRDGYRFYGPFHFPRVKGMLLHALWVYDWRTIASAGKSTATYAEPPGEWEDVKPEPAPVSGHMAKPFLYAHDECLSPDKTTMALIEDSNIGFDDPERAKRVAHLVVRRLQPPRADLVVRAENEDPAPSRTILGWREDGQEFYFLSVGAESSSVWAVSRDANARMLYREEAGLSVPSSLSEVSRDGRTIVVVRSTNTTPDELIKLDLATGKVTVLASPNQKFQAANVAVVRLMRIACCGHDLYGRLYLPRRRVSGKKYPLVFTNYLSTPGFDASVGDEVPILPLVEHGIAVFALHSKPANIISRSQDFRFEIQRVAQPLEAMEWVRRQLADEGIIDPARCGLSGLSYGAEIAMYAYWKSRAFRAISIASASWEPSNYLLAGINYAEFLNSRGLSVLDAEWRSRWAELSASLNLRPAMPPLLMQSSDQEEYFGNVELWFQLRRRGLPVEWHLFPNEGHVKRSPADRWWIYQRNLDWFLFWLCGQADRDPTKAAQYVRWEAMKKTADPVE